MKISYYLTIFFSTYMVVLFSQDCAITVTALDSSRLLLGLPFVKYIVDRDTNGTDIYVEYPTQVKNQSPVKPQIKINVIDSYDSIMIKANGILIEATINTSVYGVNRAWVESVQPTDSGTAVIGIKDGRIRLHTVETYEVIRDRLMNCVDIGGGGSDFIPLASNGLNMDGDTTQLGGTLNQNTTVSMALKQLNFTGNRFNEGLRMDDANDNYLFGTGQLDTEEDAYVNAYRDISGFGRLTFSAYQILIGVPAGNGYHLPNTRPGGNPTSFPTGTRWFPVWDRTGSGTGSNPGWYQVPVTRTASITDTTDVNGDITVTFSSAMPDTTYMVTVTPVATTRYATSVHSISTTGMTINTGAGSGVSVTIIYKVEDY